MNSANCSSSSCNSFSKIKENNKTKCRNKTMARTKATVRKPPTFVPAPEQRIGNKNILNRRLRNAPIKKLLPQTKQVKVK